MIELADSAEAVGAAASSVVVVGPVDAPPRAVLVCYVAANSSTTGTTSNTVVDSAGLTWTRRAFSAYSGSGTRGYAAIWTAPCPAGASNVTVTVTTTGSTSTTRRPQARVEVLEGCDLGNLVATAVGGGTTTLNSWVLGGGGPPVTAKGQVALLAASEWNKLGTPSATNLDVSWPVNPPGADGVASVVGRRAANGASTFSMGADAAGTGAAEWRYCYVILNAAVGVGFIPELPGASVAVEAAWGADLAASPGTWVWDDVTADVRIADGITGSMGRNDEASSTNPAKLSLVLDNAAGRYSLGGQSPLWPNVRRNTPVRVRVDPADGLGSRTVFHGYAVGFTPGWDTDNGKIPTTELEAAGILRRLKQGADPESSALYRYHTITEVPAEYWPLEEDKSATTGLNVADGLAAYFQPIDSGGTLYGKVAWGAADDNAATQRAPEVSAGGGLYLPFRSSLFSTTGWTLTWSMRYVQSSGAFLRVRTDGGAGFNYYFVFYTDGLVEMYGVQTGSSFLMLSWNQGQPYEWDGRWRTYTLRMTKPGATTTTTMHVDGVQRGSNVASPGFNYRPAQMEVTSSPNPGGVEDPVALAHVAGWTSPPAFTSTLESAGKAWVGEPGGARITRLCAEQNVPVTVTGTAPVAMGPQRPRRFLDLLDEVEESDQGILVDGVGPGLTYLARSVRENAPVALTVSAADMRGSFTPVDDDQRNVNRSTASGRTGAKFTFEDTTGPLGTGAIGVYDSSVDVNTFDPDLVPSYASWQVHLGTVEGYRYPSVPLDLRAVPVLAPAVLAATPSTRVGVTDIGTVLAGMPEGDVGLLVEGTSWSLSPFDWRVTLKCSPAQTWRIAEVAAETGDTDPEVFRLQTDGAVLASSAAAGATTLSVTTTTGPLWTTVADDRPFDVLVGGVLVRVTGISGISSPQTFTIAPLSVARPAGVAVEVHEPPVLGLG